MTPDDPIYERGMQVRREVLGDEHVDAAISRATGFTSVAQRVLAEHDSTIS
jgi:hypothetical protein